jgi:predicted 3-demethylubiquinone-9 3-methyltransferase (glyoxalase superfamily)
MSKTQKISTCLWFENKDGEQAAEFYVSLFDDSKILERTKGDTPLVVVFSLKGAEFMALNGGPHFKLSEAASIMAHCEDQAEIDRLWNAFLGNGGEESQCGWLKDRWGVSWQIVPANLGDLFYSADEAANQRALQAMYGMKKLDIAALKAARAAS